MSKALLEFEPTLLGLLGNKSADNDEQNSDMPCEVGVRSLLTESGREGERERERERAPISWHIRVPF